MAIGLSSLFYTLCRSSSTEPNFKVLKSYFIELGLILILAFNYLKHSYLYIDIDPFPNAHFIFSSLILTSLIMIAFFSVFYYDF